jgi:hypothetical protein
MAASGYVLALGTVKQRKILEVLRKLKVEGPVHKDMGLCFNMKIYIEDYIDAYDVVRDLATKWPHFSGQHSFPISTGANTPADVQYRAHKDDGRGWDRRRKYAKLRWDLLDFMISEVEAILGTSK